MKKKYRFTLLEVIAAIALTACCAPLLISLPFRLAKKEIELLFLTELVRLVDQEASQLQIDFDSHGPCYTELIAHKSGSELLQEKELEIMLTPKQRKKYLLRQELVSIKKRTGGVLLEIKMVVYPKQVHKQQQTFTYLFALPPLS
jgi:hypothetical protein